MYDQVPLHWKPIELAAQLVRRKPFGTLSCAAAKMIRDQHDLLCRIAIAYPAAVGPDTCPPKPHACDKCEIYFLLQEAGYLEATMADEKQIAGDEQTIDDQSLGD